RVIRAGGLARRPMTASAVMLLPHPDSPTRHSVSPRPRRKLAPSTRSTPWPSKRMVRSSTASTSPVGADTPDSKDDPPPHAASGGASLSLHAAYERSGIPASQVANGESAGLNGSRAER